MAPVGDRRHASTAAAVDGTTVVANSHSPGSTQLFSPIGSSTATEGVPRPDSSMIVPITPPAATNDSTATKILRNGCPETVTDCCSLVAAVNAMIITSVPFHRMSRVRR